MNMFIEYLKERENKDVILEDFGFCVYGKEKDHIYIQDVYVCKDERRKGHTGYFLDKVEDIAKDSDIKVVMGSFCLKAENWPHSKKMLQKRGFKYFTKDKWNKIIYCVKEIN